MRTNIYKNHNWKRFYRFFPLLFLTLFHCSLSGQVMEDGHFNKALRKGTRHKNGLPGAHYWQNTALYQLDVHLKPNESIEGSGKLFYVNHSPDTLKIIRLKIYQNLHRLTCIHLTPVDSAYFTNGLQFTRLIDSENNIDYLKKTSKVNWLHEGTLMDLTPAEPLLPGDTFVLDMAWHYNLNDSRITAPRESLIDSTTAFIGYWYPRVAVYDDIWGWDDGIQNENNELYNDFCNYDVHITMPTDYKVWATGMQKGMTTVNGLNNWYFKADMVSDFAWATSNHYQADTLQVILQDGVHTVVAAYQSLKQYPHVADISAKCLKYYAEDFPGMAYPFKKLTVFEGRSQMEYPMMVNDFDDVHYTDMATVTAHEIAHGYFPFMMGINETRYAWMDEGWAVFFEYHFMHDALKIESGINTFLYFYHHLLNPVASVSSIPLMAPSDQLAGSAYSANSYTKAWLLYETVRNELGDTLFSKTLKSYMHTWQGKHPTAYDFFNYFNIYSHKDLNWIWGAYCFRYGTFDLSIENVKEKDGEVEVLVKNIGGLPLPFTIEISLVGRKMQFITVPTSVWQKSNETTVKFRLHTHQMAGSLHIDTGIYPDINMNDNDYYLRGKPTRHRRQKPLP